MKHEDAALLLTDYASGSLDSMQMESVHQHVAECAECTELLQTISELDSLSDSWRPLLDAHPDADLLSQWALSTPELPLKTDIRIAAHVQVCPSCAAELEVIENSIGSADNAWNTAKSWFALTKWVSMPSLVPVAMAATILVLAVPTLRHIRQDGRDLAVSTLPPTFDLGSPTRGDATLIEFQRALPQQLLLIDYPTQLLDGRPPAGAITVELRQTGSEDPSWSVVENWAKTWNGESGILSLLVPTDALSAGPHRLIVDWGVEGVPATIFEIDFVLRP